MTPREFEELVRRMNQQIILQRRRARFVASGVLGGGSSYSQVIEDYLAQLSTEGFTAPSNTILDVLETFFASINYSALDFIHIFRMGNASLADAASVKFIRPSLSLGAYANGLTYGTGGITGDGATTYFDTQFNPATDALHYALDSACRFMYVGVDATAGTAMDGLEATASNRMLRINSNQQRINQSGTNINVAIDLSGTGYRSINRSDNTNLQFYTGLTQSNRTATSSSVISANQLVLRTTSVYSNATIEMFGMGASMSEADHNAMRNAWVTARASL